MTSRHDSTANYQLVAGGCAGLCSSLVSTPFDVCKTILQVQKQPRGATCELNKYSGVSGTFRTIAREEGIRGIYRGLGTTMLALAPNWGVYFYAYHQFKALGLSSGYFKETTSLYICTAMSAAAVTDFFCNPLWMIKTRLQTQQARSRKYRSTLHAFSCIVREEGPRALWQGFVPQLFGVVHVAIQFPLYEHLKKVLSEGEQRPTLSSPVQIVLAASISKAIASVVAYPHEILRSRLQYQQKLDPNRYKGLIDAIVRIKREEGLGSFYRGMTANLLRVVPSCAVTFTAYETILKLLTDL